MLKYFISNVIYSCDGKAKFSAVITPVFSVTLFFFIDVLLHIFVETMMH